MSDHIIPLRSGGPPPEFPTTLWRAIYLWLISQFHVHHWVDEGERGNVTNMAGSLTGYFYIQRCAHPACAKRRVQTVKP